MAHRSDPLAVWFYYSDFFTNIQLNVVTAVHYILITFFVSMFLEKGRLPASLLVEKGSQSRGFWGLDHFVKKKRTSIFFAFSSENLNNPNKSDVLRTNDLNVGDAFELPYEAVKSSREVSSFLIGLLWGLFCGSCAWSSASNWHAPIKIKNDHFLLYPFGSLCVKADLRRNHCVHITLHPTRCYVMLCY